MNAIHIEIDGNEVTIQTKDGVLVIDTPKGVSVVVNYMNAGIPGVIGPDIEVNCDSVVGKILEEATNHFQNYNT